MSQENWIQIEEFPNYEVSNKGNVRNVKTKELLTRCFQSQKYPIYKLYKNGKSYVRYAHILVLEAFVSKRPDKLACHFNDGDSTNCELDNLRWDKRVSLHRQGSKAPNSKLDEDDVVKILDMYANGNSIEGIARIYKVSSHTIRSIITNKHWTHVPRLR